MKALLMLAITLALVGCGGGEPDDGPHEQMPVPVGAMRGAE